MMGTRSGSIDPSIIGFVMKEAGMDANEVTNALNKQSGFLGVCGEADCRDVEALINQGDENASLAYEMYTDRVAKYVANYYLELNGEVDAIVFTAGIGENGPKFRKKVLDKLNPIGIMCDDEVNSKIAGFLDLQEGIISDPNSKVNVFVLPTNEEIMIVKDTFKIAVG